MMASRFDEIGDGGFQSFDCNEKIITRATASISDAFLMTESTLSNWSGWWRSLNVWYDACTNLILIVSYVAISVRRNFSLEKNYAPWRNCPGVVASLHANACQIAILWRKLRERNKGGNAAREWFARRDRHRAGLWAVTAPHYSAPCSAAVLQRASNNNAIRSWHRQ
jgi:anti-sigma-K factor RskA